MHQQSRTSNSSRHSCIESQLCSIGLGAKGGFDGKEEALRSHRQGPAQNRKGGVVRQPHSRIGSREVAHAWMHAISNQGLLE